MKKLFCILLSLIMILSLAACGEDDSSGRKKKKDKDKEDTSSVVIDNREKIENINGGYAFSDGVAVVYCGWENDVEIYKIIDKEGYICGELEDFYPGYDTDCTYKNGALVQNDKIYNKSGKVVASPEQTGYTKLLSDARVDGKILAVKIEENYSGDVLYFGILNTKGEWIEPLSDSHAITNFLVENGFVTTDLSRNNFQSDEVIQIVSNCYYNMKTGEVSYYFNNIFDTYENIYDSNGSYIGYTRNIYRRTTVDDSEKLVENMCLDYCGENGFVAHPYNTGVGENTEEYYYYDLNGTLITKLDITGFVGAEWADGHLIVMHRNSTGSEYLSIYKDDGQKVVEPFRYDGYLYSCRVYADYGIFSFGEENYYSFSGEKLVFDGYNNLYNFGEGLFLADNENYERFYIDTKGNVVIE